MRTAIVGYLGAVGGTLTASMLAAAGLRAMRSSDGPADVSSLVAGGLASSVALLLVALVATPPPRRRRLGLQRSGVPAGLLPVMGLGMLALSQCLESLTVVLEIDAAGALPTIQRALADASAGWIAVATVSLGGLAAFAEELFFRGFMLGRLRERWPSGRAIVVTAAGFGLLHLDPVHAALAFGLGCYLGFVADRSRSVLPAVLCHIVNNVVSILLLATVGPLAGVGPNLALAVLTLLLFMGAVIAVGRRLPAGEEAVVGGPTRIG